MYPALSIIRYLTELQNREGDPDLEPAYIGNSRGLERSLVPPAGIASFFLPMAPPGSLRGLSLLTLATLRSLIVVRRLKPRVAFATGGYVSAPASVAAWISGVPLVLFLPDVVPGKAVARLVPLAHKIAVSTEDALPHLPAAKAVVTGYPVRESFAQTSREQGRKRFNLPEDATVLCVFGGSQGARSINEALGRYLPYLLAHHHILHVCGEKRFPEAQAAARLLSAERQARYQLYAYLHDQDMADALASADLVLSRSGASVLGELPAVGTPGLLVPYPNPAVHQRENAEYLANRGAALILDDAQLPDQLGDVLDTLLGDRDRLRRMATTCRALARPRAAADIASLLAKVAA